MSVRHRSKRWDLSSFFARGHVAGRLRRELHARQRQRHELDEIGLIIDDEYERWRHG